MKEVTKESAMKWLDKQIATAKNMAIKFRLDKDTTIEVCNAPTNELHMFRARNVKKLAEFLEVPYEVHDPWCEDYSDHVEVSFMYNGWRIFGIDIREVFYDEKAEVTD